jgi:hypothetical protein
MTFLRRIAPAVLLFFFAPLVAEYVLGDLTFAQLGALFALAPLYGAGAILIREIVIRTGRRWPTFFLLALAYAIFEEGLLTQSLFNPNYLHLRLIDYGFVPALGTAIPWAIFVVTIHVVWSLSFPTAVVEAAFACRSREPWLKLPGLLVTCLLFVAGALLVLHFSLTQTAFRASVPQILACALLILMCIGAAFIAFPRANEPSRDLQLNPVKPVVLVIGALTLGSAFQLANSQGKAHLPWPTTAGLQVAIVVVAIALLTRASAGRTWTAVHNWSAATGGILCYVWLGYTVDFALHGPADLVPHSLFVAAALVITVWAGLRAARDSSRSQSSSAHSAPQAVPIG